MTSKAHLRYRRSQAWKQFWHRLTVFLVALLIWAAMLALFLWLGPTGALGRLPH